MVLPLRKVVPSVGTIDMATLLLVLLVTAIKLTLVSLLNGVSLADISPLGLTLTTLLDTIDLTLNVFLFAIFIQAILSWVNPDPYNPVIGLPFS